MDSNLETIKDLVMQDFPLSFVEGLVLRKEFIYNEAKTKANDETAWDETEAQYIEGHFRRCLFEKEFRQLGINYNGEVKVEENSIKAYKYTTVSFGRFVLTQSFAKNENTFVQDAIFRKQLAEVNALLSNPRLPFPEYKKTGEVSKIYAIILHSFNTNKKGFLRLAIPSSQSNKYVSNLNLVEIYEEMLASNYNTSKQSMVDLATPTLKKNVKNEGK